VRDHLTAVGYQKGFETGPNGNWEGWGIGETIIVETQVKYRTVKEMLERS